MRKMVINLNVKPRIDSRGYTIINNNRCAQCRGQDYAMGVKYKWNYKFLHFLSSLMLNAHIVNEPYKYPLQWKRKKKQSKGGFKHLKPPPGQATECAYHTHNASREILVPKRWNSKMISAVLWVPYYFYI